MPQSTKGVDAIRGVEVTSGRDGVFSTVGGCTVAPRQGIMGEIVVPETVGKTVENHFTKI